MNEQLYFFWSIFLTFLFVLTALLFYLIGRKLREQNDRKQIEQYKLRAKDFLLAYIYEGKDSRFLFPDNRLKRTALEELLNELSHDIRGTEAEKRMQGFAEQFFAIPYRKLLIHRRWSIRMNILYLIEEFRLKSLSTDVIYLYKKRKITKAEEGQILRMLAIFEHEELYHYICHTKHNLSELTYRVIYGSMSEKMFSRFAEKFHELPKEILQFTFIDMVGITKRVKYGRFLEELLQHDHLEIRIRSLKAIAQIAHPIAIEKLIPHLHSDSWQERIMAAKICGILQLNDSVPYLTELIGDRAFQVRSQAAQSISQFSDGLSTLRKVIETTEDAFARDMAIEWLERGTEG